MFFVYLGGEAEAVTVVLMNPVTANDLHKRRAMSPLKIKVPSKKSRQAALRGGI
jgi:hypothetical protein